MNQACIQFVISSIHTGSSVLLTLFQTKLNLVNDNSNSNRDITVLYNSQQSCLLLTYSLLSKYWIVILSHTGWFILLALCWVRLLAIAVKIQIVWKDKIAWNILILEYGNVAVLKL